MKGNRTPLAIVSMAILTSVATRADPLRVSSQTWQNLIGGGVVHSPYDYDAKGLRIQRRDYNSADSSGPRIARTVWEYDAQEHLVREIQFSATDTVSIVTQAWNGDHSIRTTVWGKGGVQRYRDTVIRDAQGRDSISRRLSARGSLVSQHTFTYDAQNELVADTIWQPAGGGLVAGLALATHWENGKVTWTQEWSRSPGATRWNAQQRTELLWNGDLLASTTDLSGDGTGRVLVDSTTYTYDVSGNRTTETTFDPDRIASTRTTYFWEGATAAWRRRHPTGAGVSWKISGNRLSLEGGPTPREITVVDAGGRILLRQAGPNPSIEIGSLTQGQYLAYATFADGRTSHSFSNVR